MIVNKKKVFQIKSIQNHHLNTFRFHSCFRLLFFQVPVFRLKKIIFLMLLSYLIDSEH
jgi:hypothetical protein